MRKRYIIVRTMVMMLLFLSFFSCKRDEVKVIEVDSVWSLALFHDDITVNDALNLIDSTWNTWLKIKPNGDLYACYSDTVDKVLDAKDILWEIPDTEFSASVEFELPELPTVPGVHVNYDEHGFVSVPFHFEGFEINEAGLRDGFMNFTLSSSLNILDTVILSSSNIIMEDGSAFNHVFVGDDASFSGTVDISDCILNPDENGNVIFSASLAATTDETPVAGMQTFDIGILFENAKFAFVEGVFSEMIAPFSDTVVIDFGLENVSGDFELYTPEVVLRYINTLGLATGCNVDSLYLGDDDGWKTTIIRDWESLNFELNTTENNSDYDSIVLDEQIVDMLNLIGDYSFLGFTGSVLIDGSDNDVARMTDESFVSLAAEVEMPIKYKVREFIYTDTVDFNLGLNMDDDDFLFDEMEFKFNFENRLPMQIVPQAYFMQNGIVIDSLILSDNIIPGCYDDTVSDAEFLVSVSDDRLDRVINADKLKLKFILSTEGHEVIMNTLDGFGLRIGVGFKTSTISTDIF